MKDKPRILTDEELFDMAQNGAGGDMMRAYKALRDYYREIDVERARLAIPLRSPR